MELNEHNCDAVWDAKRSRPPHQSDEWDAMCRKIWDRRSRGEDYYVALTLILAAAGIENPYSTKRRKKNVILEDSEDLEEQDMDVVGRDDVGRCGEGMDDVGSSRGMYPDHVPGDDGIDDQGEMHLETVISRDVNDSDDDVDPQFVAALRCMKESGNAYALEDEGSGSPMLCVYEGESSLDELCESELRRKTRSGFEPVEKLGLLNHEQERNAIFIGGKCGEDLFGTEKNGKGSNDGIRLVSSDDEQERDNQVTSKLVERVDVAQSKEKYNVQRSGHLKKRVEEKNTSSGDSQSYRNWKKTVKKKNVAAGDNDAYNKAGTRKSKGHMLPKSSQRLHPVTEVVNTIYDIAQRGEADKVQNLKGKGVVHVCDEPVRRLNKRSREEQSGSDEEAQDKQEKGLQSRTEMKKVLKLKKLMNGDHRRLGKLDNGRVHEKRDPVKKIHVERVDNGRLYHGVNVDRRSNKHDEVEENNKFRMSKNGYLKHITMKNGESRSDMEMLDRTAILKKGNPSSSIALKKHVERVEHKKVKVDRLRKAEKVMAEQNVIKMGRKGYKNTKKNGRGKLSDEDSRDVEILDAAAIMEEGNRSCFVPAMRHTNEAGGSSACAGFRESVLKDIKRPYDHDEYQQLVIAFKSYHKTSGAAAVQRRLTKYRRNAVIRLGLLRGFFYWVQNVVHDNTFRPWKDRECLDARPASA